MWIEEWRALAARIDGLLKAGQFLLESLHVHSNDVMQIFKKSLIPEFQAISNDISALGTEHSEELPTKALSALNKYVSHEWHRHVATAGGADTHWAIPVLAPLAAFRSEFEYLIRDTEVEARSTTELAFEHLKRQIAVDEDVKKKWKKAFARHETDCEKLGAVHLLGHGIWAFKAVSTGAATDLIFADPIESQLQRARRIARALVLTEWKRVQNRDSNRIAKIVQEARLQAEKYASGLLGDHELKRTRYIVLVTKHDLQPPKDEIDDRAITYRHIIIPTDPQSPSVHARSARRIQKT